jgi:hypothetical protein
MKTSLRWFSGSLVIVILTIAGVACSSSTPLKKTVDAPVARDLGADERFARDLVPDAAGPDLAEPDLLVQVIPDASSAGKDTAVADLLAAKDEVAADLPAGKDTILVDLPASRDIVLADLSATVADVPVGDIPAGDVPPAADLVTQDGPPHAVFDCRSAGIWPTCNDNPISEAIMGTCQPDGTCLCNLGYVINPSTGRCMYSYPKRDASTSSEAGPAAVCTGDYTACGCGCCGSVPGNTRCYYPSLGETVAAIAAQDEATRLSTNCDLAGCSIGVHYLCCAPAAPDPPASATYSASGYSGGLDHVTITRSGADCATLSFESPTSSAGSDLRITMPDTWGVAIGLFGTCGDAGATDRAKGAVGTFALRASGSLCLADVHATLFAFTATGEVKTTRLDADGLAVVGFPTSLCN